MHFDNSLTFNVQFYIETVIAKKFAAREKDWNLKSSAESFREFLCAAECVNTLDFVIRRYIQARHSELLPSDEELVALTKDEEHPDGEKLADLTEDMNLPWHKNVLQFLAQKLFDLSQAQIEQGPCETEQDNNKQGIKIEKKEWLNYLSGAKGIRDREKAFLVAFTLGMTIEDTLDILLSCGLEPYSVRHPLDLICTFCQKRPGRYTWVQAEDMYDEFWTHRTACKDNLNAPTKGMTVQITSELEKIYGKDQGDDDAKKELVQYMVANAGEFPAFVKRVQRKDKKTKSVYYKDMEYFLPGYSMTRTEQYQRLAQYLAMLYPSYIRVKRKKSKTNNSVSEIDVVMVSQDENGIPDLPQLVRSMLLNSNLVAKEFDWDLSKFESGDEEYDDASYAFEQQMKKYWSNYLQHIMAVDRLLTKEDSTDDGIKEYQNYEYFRRNDILLFLYFLIDGYRKTVIDKDENTLTALKTLRENGDGLDKEIKEFDDAIVELLKKVEYLFTKFRDDQNDKKVNMLRECFNLILAQMDYEELYLPSLFDRLFFSMLLCDDSHNLLRMVLCQGEF